MSERISRKIKVSHIARFGHPHIGGIEAVINQINESLPDEEFEKEVFCCSNTEKSSVENCVKYHRCRYLFDFAANSISPQLFFRMMFLKTDIIHFHMPVIQNVVIWFILYHLGLLKYKKMIISYHGAIVGYDKYMRPFESLYRYFFLKADLIHVLSPDIINSDKILLAHKDKCNIIPYGINIDTKDYSNESKIINGYNIEKFTNGRKKLLSMGRLVNWKGYFELIKAMSNVEDAVLLIAGDGNEYLKYKKYIQNNNLQNKVLLLGSITNKKEKEILFSLIDIFILPSIRTSESFGIVQLEAMKHSKPIINTQLGTGVNYVSLNNETGLTVEPNNSVELANAINKLLKNEELSLKYGIRARRRVEELFDINKIRKKYKELYK